MSYFLSREGRIFPRRSLVVGGCEDIDFSHKNKCKKKIKKLSRKVRINEPSVFCYNKTGFYRMLTFVPGWKRGWVQGCADIMFPTDFDFLQRIDLMSDRDAKSSRKGRNTRLRPRIRGSVSRNRGGGVAPCRH